MYCLIVVCYIVSLVYYHATLFYSLATAAERGPRPRCGAARRTGCFVRPSVEGRRQGSVKGVRLAPVVALRVVLSLGIRKKGRLYVTSKRSKHDV